jgi:hypothetical protein
MRRALTGPLSFGLSKAIASPEGVGDIIRSIFADGTDGLYFNFAELDELFTGSRGPTNVAVATDAIGLALDDHGWGSTALTQQIAAATELVANGNFSGGATTSWTARASASLSVVSGALRVTNGAASYGYAFQAVTTVVGRTYRVSVTGVSATLAAVNIGTSEAGSQYQSDLNISASTYVRYIVATSTTMYIALKIASNTISATADFDDISVKWVGGNHGVQATGAAQPKWQTGGLARFDGTDDNLLTTLVPGTAMTLLFKGVIPAASASLKVFLGTQESSTGRCHLYMNTSGNLACAAGDNSFNSAISIASTTCVIGAIFSGGQSYFCHNGSVTAAGAYTGDPTALRQLAIGARNVNGSLDLFSNPDAAHALAIKKALTAAEIAAITNLWGTS